MCLWYGKDVKRFSITLPVFSFFSTLHYSHLAPICGKSHFIYLFFKFFCLNNRKIYFLMSWRLMPKIKVCWLGWFLLACRCGPLSASSHGLPCVCASLVSLCVHSSPPTGSGLTLMASFNLITSI